MTAAVSTLDPYRLPRSAAPRRYDVELTPDLTTATFAGRVTIDVELIAREHVDPLAFPTALPDRWTSWFWGAVPAGLSLIRRYKPRVLWSTFPIATSHLIALTLHRLTGIAWVAGSAFNRRHTS